MATRRTRGRATGCESAGACGPGGGGAALGLAILLASAAALGAPIAQETAADVAPGWGAPAWRWRTLPVGASGQGEADGEGGGLLAVAASASGPTVRIAVADSAGVSLREASGAFRFVARVRGVTDLAFAPDGSLWIASLSGLWNLSPERRLSLRAPGPGEGARAVRRVATAPGVVAVATDAGAFVSCDGVAWQRLADGLPNGPVSAVAWRAPAAAAGAGRELWLTVGRQVWRVRLEPDGSRLVPADARRVPVAGAPAAQPASDLVVDLPGAAVTLVYAHALAVLAPEAGSFELLRPVLPPGAVARRLVAGAGRVWLATDQGLLQAPRVWGPWRRTAAPAGSAAIQSLAVTRTGDGLLAVGPLGLLQGAPVLRAGSAPARAVSAGQGGPDATRAAIPPDPDIRDVQAAALRYQGLGPERIRSMWKGLAHRGWIPTVSVKVAGAQDHSRGRDWDDSVSSGTRYMLVDHGHDHSLGLDASLVMTWDLPGLAFDDDAIDISREQRLVVGLRDNVIDEIDQLYFERRGLLEKLRATTPGEDTAALELRAAELAAGLDAWTGGWFSRNRPVAEGPSLHAPPGPVPEDPR